MTAIPTLSLAAHTVSRSRLLLETPAIAKYIRHLDIRIMRQEIICRPYAGSEYLFGQVPRQLTRLQSLAIWPSHYPHNDWNNNSSSMQRSLLNLMHLPTLSHLNLGWISNFPISDLITCTNLKHLSVQEFHITGEDEQAASSLLHKPIQLQAFHISILKSGPEALRLLTVRCSDGRPVLDIVGLKKIGVGVHNIEHVHPIREIFRISQQLTDIRIEAADVCFRAMELAKTITPSLRTLRRLELVILIDGVSDPDPLVGLCDELENVLGKNRLESLEIKIEVSTDEDCQTGDEWGRLEKVLLKSGWPMLKHVSLDIVMFVYSRLEDGPFEIALENLPQTQFTGLVSSKNLDFRFSVRKELV